MESVAAERLNKIGIRDQNFVGNGSASDNEATSVSQDAQEMSAIVSALGTILILRNSNRTGWVLGSETDNFFDVQYCIHAEI
jgi:hypothetical protein